MNGLALEQPRTAYAFLRSFLRETNMKAPTVKRTGVTTHGNSGNLLPNCAFTAPAIASCVHCQLMNASLGDAIIGYTMNAAYASFEEDVKGSIEVGKFAYMIILSDNLFETGPDDAAKVDPLLTIVVGKEVCRSYRFPR